MLQQPSMPDVPGIARDPGPPPVVSWLPFVAVTVLATALAATGVLPRWAGIVHSVAPPPLDLSFDLRVLIARSPSYGVFVAGAAASLLVRSLVLAALLEALGDQRPLSRRFVTALRTYLVAFVFLGAGAALEFAGLASVYAWYAWAGLGLTLLACFSLLQKVVGEIRPIRAIVTLATVALLGALAEAGGGVVPVALVPVSALLTGWALAWMSGRRGSRSASTTTTTAVAAGTALAFLLSGVPASSAPVLPHSSILVVPGVDTSSGEGAAYRLGLIEQGFRCSQIFYYSYVGPGEGAPRGEAPCRLRLHAPYEKEDTQKPLVLLVQAFAGQVAAIRAETEGAPVAVISHSQGAVIAWAAVSSGAAEGVSHIIALGGFPRSPVAYPPPGQDGAGHVGADALRALSAGSRALGHGTFSPDAPLAREILAREDGLESVFAQDLPPGVSARTVTATMDVIVAPEGWRIPGVPAWTVDSTHVGMIESPATAGVLGSILREDRPASISLQARALDLVVHAFMPPPAGA